MTGLNHNTTTGDYRLGTKSVLLNIDQTQRSQKVVSVLAGSTSNQHVYATTFVTDGIFHVCGKIIGSTVGKFMILDMVVKRDSGVLTVLSQTLNRNLTTDFDLVVIGSQFQIFTSQEVGIAVDYICNFEYMAVENSLLPDQAFIGPVFSEIVGFVVLPTDQSTQYIGLQIQCNKIINETVLSITSSTGGIITNISVSGDKITFDYLSPSNFFDNMSFLLENGVYNETKTYYLSGLVVPPPSEIFAINDPDLMIWLNNDSITENAGSLVALTDLQTAHTATSWNFSNAPIATAIVNSLPVFTLNGLNQSIFSTNGPATSYTNFTYIFVGNNTNSNYFWNQNGGLINHGSAIIMQSFTGGTVNFGANSILSNNVKKIIILTGNSTKTDGYFETPTTSRLSTVPVNLQTQPGTSYRLGALDAVGSFGCWGGEFYEIAFLKRYIDVTEANNIISILKTKWNI